ncbi:unnamed protein product [Didymodactylos carnosus]|uniref:Uncharacterized protein n=1 Tax=Didymodactylos carnosus TaxID=1234261 RepID=A0A814WFZ7_9BILA|nr:unnamed protein product [Didymodactylos carnosus]CAF3966409.1 unnamed protein product [Didymodactylos carnosus]
MGHNGKIQKQGSFDELLTLPKVKKSFEQQKKHSDDANKKKIRNNTVENNEFSDDLFNTIDKNSILTGEISMGGTISIKVWLKLFTSSYGWCGFVVLIILLLVGEAVYDAGNRWLSLWARKSNDQQRVEFNAYVYLSLAIGTLIISLIRADYFFHLILRGASTLHNNMLKGVLYSPLRFYESNPVGRILNRFSKDQQVLDELLPLTFFDTVQSLVMTVGSVAIIGITNPWVLLILILIIPTFLWLRRFYIRTSRELKRLDSITRSPVYALFSSSLGGLMTIRAFNVENNFIDLFIDKVNTNTRAFFMLACTIRWFGLRLDLMTSLLSCLTAILSITLRNHLDASSVALGLTYCINLTTLFQWGVRQSADTENYMTSAERIYEYSHLPPEEDFNLEDSELSADWPTEGKIQFKDYELRYRSELGPVLKKINLEIESCDKIGIIGRTGAGKSSIFQAIFRLTDKSTSSGQILIDGVDINTVGLCTLRSKLNIIPQAPVLFSTTLRYNLDPFKKHTDEELWDALDIVQLKPMVQSLKDGIDTQMAEYGSNFSVGECQLICVARAILKPSKILLIDEATANVDTHTDELIQRVIRDKFKNQTVLTIAHRINTIIDSKKIVVMSDGCVTEYGKSEAILTHLAVTDEEINEDMHL